MTVTLIVVVLVVGILVGIAKRNQTATKVAANTCAGKAYPIRSRVTSASTLRNTLTLFDIAVTATGFTPKTDTSSRGTLCSSVTLRNNSAGSRDYSAFQFKVQTPNGDVPTQSFRTIEGALETGTIIAGTTGFLCTDDKGAKGQYVRIYRPKPLQLERGI